MKQCLFILICMEMDQYLIQINPIPPPPPPPGIVCYDYNMFKYWVETDQLDSLDAESMFKSIDSSKVFKLDSSRLKIKLINQDKILEIIKNSNNDLYRTYNEIENIYGTKCFIRVSTPIYNSDLTRLIITIDYMCGPLNGYGSKFIFKKIDGDWWLINEYGTWES